VSLFPENDRDRKMLPVFKMITRYFPKALREVTRVCVANNVRYSPDREAADITWARGKSTDQLGSAFRHMLESAVDGRVFEPVPAAVTAATGIERSYVLAEAAWRVLAALELEIEAHEANERSQQVAEQALAGIGSEVRGQCLAPGCVAPAFTGGFYCANHAGVSYARPVGSTTSSDVCGQVGPFDARNPQDRRR